MSRQIVFATCPAKPACFWTAVHRCVEMGACPIDAGLQLAYHVAALHPELVYTPAQLERRRLAAQMSRRTN